MSATTRWVGLCAVLCTGLAFDASAKSLQGKIYNGSAYIDIQVSGDLSSTISRVQKSLPQMIERVPGLKLVHLMTDIPVGAAVKTANSVTKKTQKLFQVKHSDPRILPDSLISIEEDSKECVAEKPSKEKEKSKEKEEDKDEDSDCTPSYSFAIKGPVFSYQRFQQALDATDATVLSDSFTVTLTVSTVEEHKSKVDLTLTLNNSNYQQFFRQLKANRLIEDVPTEREVKAGFLLWAHDALELLGTKR